MNKNLLIFLSVAGLLAGCATVPTQRRIDEQTCRGYGFKSGSDSFANCLLQLDLNRRADRRFWQNQAGANTQSATDYRVVAAPVIK
nr:hypothetical protein [Ochrobactrum sp. CM-21-5]